MQNIVASARLLISLGFVLHPEKSQFIPSTKVDILGFTIDSVKMIVTLTEEKRNNLLKLLQEFVKKNVVPVRKLAQIIGKLIATFPGVMYGPLHFRQLEYNKIQGLRENGGNFEGYVHIHENAKEEIRWWINNLPHAYNVIKHKPPSVTIYTDASKKGWGATLNAIETGGAWNKREQRLHINEKEMLAVHLGSLALTKMFSDIYIKLLIDNSVVVSILNKMGTSHNEILNNLVFDIWEYFRKKNIWITANYVSTDENRADKPSRKLYIQGEWQLKRSILNNCLKKLQFTPRVDLFATRLNAQFNKFVSYHPDPHAIAVDAFSLDWSNIKFYCFPPFRLLSRVLQKIKLEKATGVVVAPNWPTQPFHPMLISMCTKTPILVKRKVSNLILPQDMKLKNNIAAKTDLLVCLVSGHTCKNRDSQNRPFMLL